MKNIETILKGYEALTDDQRDEIVQAVNENYRSIEEVTKKTERISELEEQNAALTEQVGSLQGDSEEVEKLRKQVSDFEAKETERKQREEEAQKRNSFRALFDEAVGEREFVNDLMRDTVFEKAYTQCQSQNGVGAKDALDTVTKDTDGVWKNPQNDVNMMPDAALISSKKATGEEAARKQIADFMFRKR